LTSVTVDLTPTARGYDIEARVKTTAQTGVEMRRSRRRRRRADDGDM
jgi:molybdenum cofactor biosynthesis enzyme